MLSTTGLVFVGERNTLLGTSRSNKERLLWAEPFRSEDKGEDRRAVAYSLFAPSLEFDSDCNLMNDLTLRIARTPNAPVSRMVVKVMKT